MHELAITESIIESVLERVPDRKITKVLLEIGRLSGVEPEAVRFCFDVAAHGTPLDGAALDVVVLPLRARCNRCAAEFEPPDALPLCACGSADVEIRSGKELRIRSVEVV